MALFETNEYYYSGGASQDWFKYISPLIGVVVGFFLSQGADWYRRKRRRKRIGSQYEYHLKILKGALTVNIRKFSAYIENYKVDVAAETGVASTRESLQVLKSIDVLELSEYIQSKKGASEADKIHQHMSTINFLEYETQRMDDEILKAVVLMNDKGRELRRAFESIGIEIISGAEVVKKGNGADPYLKKVEPIAVNAFVSTRSDANYWVVAEAAMRDILEANGQYSNHPFAKKVDDLFKPLIPKFKTLLAEREHAIRTMEQTVNSLEICNKSLPIP